MSNNEGPTTSSSDTPDFDALAAEILDDGVIDADEVVRLKEILYADGVIDRREADFLFRLNDAVSGKANDPSWRTFFVEAILDHLLEDDESPGEVDADEADWLIAQIEGDGEYDATERALLEALESRAVKIHARLRFKIGLIGQ